MAISTLQLSNPIKSQSYNPAGSITKSGQPSLSSSSYHDALFKKLFLRPQTKRPKKKTQQKASLATLPSKVYLKILSYLRPAESACLGLTCNRLYGIHWDIHNRVYLWETTREIELHELLTVWMGNLKYDGIRRHIDGNAKFIKEERLHRNVTPSFKQIHDWYS